MKAVQVSASLSRSAGGIFEIELALSQHLQRLGLTTTAFGLDDVHWAADSARWAPVVAEVCKVSGPAAFGYSRDLYSKIIGANADLGHLHSLWMYPSVAIRKWSEKTGKPYVVTPNGMLEPWALQNSAWKKKIAGALYERRCLQSASCLQANTEKELRDFRAYGLKTPIAIIPNGIELPEVGGRRPEGGGQRSEAGDQRLEVRDQKSGIRQQTTGNRPRVLLFLGRLHPKKGLANALRAWGGRHAAAGMRHEADGMRHEDEWQFVIAGWDQGGHEAELKRLCVELGLTYEEAPVSEFLTRNHEQGTKNHSSSVLFVGPAFGEQKDALLRSASAFILPSFSEGLPMSVLEAWSYRLPVLMTDHCNLPEGFAADAAIHIGTDPESIAEGLRQLFRSPPSDLRSLGENGRALVERQFTWPQVAAQMKEVYEWVLGGGEVPGCVER